MSADSPFRPTSPGWDNFESFTPFSNSSFFRSRSVRSRSILLCYRKHCSSNSDKRKYLFSTRRKTKTDRLKQRFPTFLSSLPLDRTSLSNFDVSFTSVPPTAQISVSLSLIMLWPVQEISITLFSQWTRCRFFLFLCPFVAQSAFIHIDFFNWFHLRILSSYFKSLGKFRYSGDWETSEVSRDSG